MDGSADDEQAESSQQGGDVMRLANGMRERNPR